MSEPGVILRKYLRRKQQSNPKYSLRSFARDLKVSPAFASRLMNGKQEIPIARLARIAQILDMDELALKDLKKAITLSFMDSLGLKARDFGLSQAHLSGFSDKPSSAKAMTVLDPWFNLAIMDLTTCEEFLAEPSWIARRLGIKKEDAARSLDFLKSNGWIELRDGQYSKTEQQIRLPTRQSLSIVRGFHKSMLEKGIQEMYRKTDEASFRDRLITSSTVAVNRANLPAAKERMAELQIELAEILRDGPCTEVYDLSLLLFPLSR